MFHHDDTVGNRHGRESVRDDDGRAVGEERLQSALHEPFTGDVEGRGRFVEDEHGGVGEKRPRKREQLALARREPTAALVDIGVVTLGKRHDEVVGADCPRGRFDLLGCGIGFSERKVFGHAAGEQVRLLRDHDHAGAQVVVGEFAQVDPVETHRAGVRVVEAGDEFGEGGFAGARRAHERNGLTRGNV